MCAFNLLEFHLCTHSINMKDTEGEREHCRRRPGPVAAVLLRGCVPGVSRVGGMSVLPRLSLGACPLLKCRRLAVLNVMLMLETVFHKTWPHAAQSSPFIWCSSQKIKCVPAPAENTHDDLMLPRAAACGAGRAALTIRDVVLLVIILNLLSSQPSVVAKS